MFCQSPVEKPFKRLVGGDNGPARVEQFRDQGIRQVQKARGRGPGSSLLGAAGLNESNSLKPSESQESRKDESKPYARRAGLR
jgi:hypothetical protein